MESLPLEALPFVRRKADTMLKALSGCALVFFGGLFGFFSFVGHLTARDDAMFFAFLCFLLITAGLFLLGSGVLQDSREVEREKRRENRMKNKTKRLENTE